MPAARLTPNETEARSDWWISSRAYFDSGIGQEPPIKRHHDAAGLFNQNILNRGKREQRPRFYKRTPYMEKPPTTVLPKQHGNKNKNNLMKANLSPLNLRNAFDDENEGGAGGYSVPVTFWQQLVPHLCMPDIDSRTPVGWLSEEEDQVRQLAMMNLAHQFNDASIAKDELRKAYEECKDIPLEQRDVIENFLKIESELDYEMKRDLLWNGAKLGKLIRDKNGLIKMLL
nr:hypothetical protein [Tanacetum cinerariifolium]